MSYSGRLSFRMLITIILTVSLITTPVASQTGVSTDQQVSTNSSLTESSSIEGLELSQNVTLAPDNQTSLAPGQTYNFMIKNSIEPRTFEFLGSSYPIEFWKQSTVSNPTLRLNISENVGPAPMIRGVASPAKSYNVVERDLDTQSYTTERNELAAGSVNQIMVSVTVPVDTEEFTISATAAQQGDETVDDKITKKFDVEPVSSRSNQVANLAEDRAETAGNLYDQYDSIFNGTTVDEIVDRGMKNTFVESAKFTKKIYSLSGGGVLSKIKDGAGQFSSYADSLQTEKKFDGPWVGPMIQAQNRMLSEGFDRTKLNSVQQEGSSNYALRKLERLANEEAAAWRNGNRARALEKLRKQRDLLSARDYPTTVGGPESKSSNYNLPVEAQRQKNEADEDSVLGDDLSEGTIAYFTGIEKFSTSQSQIINEISIPLAEDPDPSVRIINKPTVRDQLATREQVTAKFSVSNTGGAAQQGYLSLVYPSQSLSVTEIKKVEDESDTSESPLISNVTDGKVSTSDGDRESIDGSLTDIWEPYQAGETNVYNVTFEQADESSGEVFVTYRTAFKPAIETGSDTTQFIRSPTDGEPGPQGWAVKNISGDAGDPEIKWNGTYNGQYADSAYEVISTEDSGYLIAGETTNFDGDNNDAFVVKVDQDGNPEWQKEVGGDIDDRVSTAVQTQDGGYLVAGYTSRVGTGGNGLWLIKFAKGGEKAWEVTYGNDIQDRALDIVATNDGGYALAGYTETVGDNPRDAWLLKINDIGQVQWNRTYTSAAYDRTEAAALVQTSDGGYALAGQSYYYPTAPDAFVVKTDSRGYVEWKNTYNFADFDSFVGNYREYATDIVQTTDGDYTFAGQWVGESGAIVHLNSDGEGDWLSSYSNISSTDDTNSEIPSLAKTSDGGYALIERYLNGEKSALIKTDENGNSEWQKKFEARTTFDASGKRIGRDVITTADGGYIVAGAYKPIDGSATSAWLTKTSGAAPRNQAPLLGQITGRPANITVGEKATIYVTEPEDTDGSIKSYDWDFNNDGSAERSTDTNTTTYTFETAGKFSVTVTATDDDGATSSTQQTIDVNAPPSASFRIDPNRPEIEEDTTLDGSYATDIDGSIQSYDWKIEDNPAQTGVSPAVSFETSGEYNVSLTVTDNNGENSTRKKVLTVAPNRAPVAEARANRTISVDKAIILNARNSSDPDGDTLSYNWELISQPESSSVSLENNNGLLQTVQPTETGKYQFKLTVTDKHGETASDVVVISTKPAIAAEFEYDKERTGKNTTVEFRATSSSDQSEISRYRWDFDGDGTVETNTSNNKTSYIYSQSGEYQVSLTVIGSDGTTDILSKSVQINNAEQVDVDLDDLPGSGTANNPYLISNISELQAIEDDLDSYYKLSSNISASQTAHWNNGKGFDPIGGPNSQFNGKFDGAGHTISGLTITRPNGHYNVALFSGVSYYSYNDPPGTIANVSLTDVNIVGNQEASTVSTTGALVGESLDDTTIRNVSVDGYVNGTDSVGGLVGENNGEIQTASANTAVNATKAAGGLVGTNSGGIITNVSANAVVNSEGSAGGLVGINSPTSQLSKAVANSTVRGNFNVGGAVGKNLATIENIYVVGSITGNTAIGAITGENTDDGTVIQSYWDEQAVEQDTSAGSGMALSTNEMTGPAATTNMTGFDFGDVWQTEPSSYPSLIALNSPQQENADTSRGIITAIDTDGDGTINDTEVLTAIDYWQDGEAVPQTNGETISDFEILGIIETWRDNRRI